MAPPVKTCPSCKRDLPASRYTLSEQRPDGLHYECKACHAKRCVRMRGGLKRIIWDIPPELREIVRARLDSAAETPAEYLERLIRADLAA